MISAHAAHLREDMNRILAEASAMGMIVDGARRRALRLAEAADRLEAAGLESDPEVLGQCAARIRGLAENLRFLAKRLEIARSLAIVKANEVAFLAGGGQDFREYELAAREYALEATHLSEALRVAG